MSAKSVGAIAVVSAILLVGIMIAVWAVGISNTEIEIRNQCKAQQDNNENIYDAVWKIISQKAQLPDKYKNDFKDVYGTIMEGRYKADDGNNPAFKWIQEQNPQFSVDLYTSLGDTIEGQRTKFTMVQARLIDIKREHDNLRLRFPAKLVVGSRPELEITIVTSTKTKKVFTEGIDDDIDLFKKD